MAHAPPHFWRSFRDQKPDGSYVIRYAALVVFLTRIAGISATEASVERVFSILKHIFRKNRSKANDLSVVAQAQLRSMLLTVPQKRSLKANRKHEANFVHDATKLGTLGVGHVSAIVAWIPEAATQSTPISEEDKRAIIRAGACKKCLRPCWGYANRTLFLFCRFCKAQHMKDCLVMRCDVCPSAMFVLAPPGMCQRLRWL